MTHSEKVYLEARERMLNAPDNTLITEDFLNEVIQDMYPELSFIEQSALLESIHIPALIEDVQEELKEEESYNHSPLAHVGMKAGDFI